MATYSSMGPTRFDHLVKPDLVAPGNKIVGWRRRTPRCQGAPEFGDGPGANVRLR
jgi:hypothetical protein